MSHKTVDDYQIYDEKCRLCLKLDLKQKWENLMIAQLNDYSWSKLTWKSEDTLKEIELSFQLC